MYGMSIESFTQSRHQKDTRLSLFEFADELTPLQRECVEIRDTHVGKGVFAVRPYPQLAIVGEIRGELIKSGSHGTNYTFDFGEGFVLEPYAPFRFVNHSCNPNCEFEAIEDPNSRTPGDRPKTRLYLITLRDIEVGEQFSIDYNWSAKDAIRCECGAVNCRGWVVAEYELDELTE